MRKTVLLLASVSLEVLLTYGMAPEPNSARAQGRPNIVFILTDDQDPESLARMNKVQSRLVDQGTRFPNAFVTTPMCCPSRATFLRGQYAHNHGTLNNDGPKGGWEKFHSDGRERSTTVTWLDDAGYTTGYIGKYLNGYGKGHTTTYVPPAGTSGEAGRDATRSSATSTRSTKMAR